MADSFEAFWASKGLHSVVVRLRTAGLDDFAAWEFVSDELLDADVLPFLDDTELETFYAALQEAVQQHLVGIASAPALLAYATKRLAEVRSHEDPRRAGAGAAAVQEPRTGAGAAASAAHTGPVTVPTAAPCALAQALARRVHRIIELAPYVPGEGGLACTDKASFAEARALLVLVAVQLHALVEGAGRELGLPSGLTITQLREAHPQAQSGDEIAVRVVMDREKPAHCQLHIPVRSAKTMKATSPQEALRGALWGLARLADNVGTSRSEADKWASQALAQYSKHPALVGRVPVGIGSLVYMGLLPSTWSEQYERMRALEMAQGLAPGPGRTISDAPVSAASPASGAGGSEEAAQGSGLGPAGHRPRHDPVPSPCLNLWWPPTAQLTPYAEAKATLKKAQEQSAAASQDDARQKRLAAAMKRMGQG